MTGQQGANSPERIDALVDDTFDVTLSEVPGSGYEWMVPDTPPAVTLVSATWAESVPAGVGGSRQRRFTLRVSRVGVYRLTFELRRRWEHEAAPAAREQAFDIHVHPAS